MEQQFLFVVTATASPGAYAGGGVHWVHVHPPPPEKKVPLRNVEKGKESSAQICRRKIMHGPLRYDKIKTKEVGKKEKKSKRKGIKERG